MAAIEPKTRETRSPLKERPLRHAGQSVNEQLDDKATDAAGFAVVSLVIIALAGMEWIRQYRHDTFHPVVLTVMALVVTAFCGWKIWRSFKEVQHLKLGRDGERIVSEFLDQLRKFGYEALHDVTGGNFNVDQGSLHLGDELDVWDRCPRFGGPWRFHLFHGMTVSQVGAAMQDEVWRLSPGDIQ